MLIKFRTMAASEETTKNLLTLIGDPRITLVGKTLRRTRLDEIPQILNVLRGEMSWIGPRPEASPLAMQYERSLPNYHYRHTILPGVTGWAQVNQGHVIGPNDIERKLVYDLYFIQNSSFWLESWIVLRTVKIMISGYGAR